MAAMTRRIVVGFDGSPPATTAVDWAAAEAARRELSLTILHAVETPELVAEAATAWHVLEAHHRHDHPHDHWHDHRHHADPDRITNVGLAHAHAYSDLHLIAGLTERGPAARLLVDASRDAELLVVGTHGHGGIAGMLGSVAITVTARAHCPVVVVRGTAEHPPGPRRPVVVGVDASPAARSALHFAADAAARSSAPLMVVCVWRPGVLSSWRHAARQDIFSDLEIDESLRRSAEARARDAARQAQRLHPRLETASRAIAGWPEEVLCDTARGAGLLVLGSRGRGNLAGLVAGSTSHGMIRTAPCPVAVVRAN